MQKYMIKVCFKLFKILATKERDSCNLYKKPMPRPVVSLPRARCFNDNVAMDLHYLNENLWYLANH